MKEIETAEEFAQELETEGLTVVKFWASWCGPCRAYAPIVEQVAEQVGPKANVISVSIEDLPELSSKYQIRSIPMTLFFKDGALVDKQVGAASADVLRAKIDANL